LQQHRVGNRQYGRDCFHISTDGNRCLDAGTEYAGAGVWGIAERPGCHAAAISTGVPSCFTGDRNNRKHAAVFLDIDAASSIRKTDKCLQVLVASMGCFWQIWPMTRTRLLRRPSRYPPVFE